VPVLACKLDEDCDEEESFEKGCSLDFKREIQSPSFRPFCTAPGSSRKTEVWKRVRGLKLRDRTREVKCPLTRATLNAF